MDQFLSRCLLIVLLLTAPATSATEMHESGSELVFVNCLDEARQIVQRKRAGECKGPVVSDRKAAHLRDRRIEYERRAVGGTDGPTTLNEPSSTDPATPTHACADGIDNDGDNLVDHPDDPGCESTTDDDETNALPPTGSPSPVFSRAKNTAVSPITLGALEGDGATTETLSLYLSVSAGDEDDDAVALVEYRQSGTSEWRQALDLFKHDKTPVAPFAGMIFGLEPDTSYDVRVTVHDPDGVIGNAVQTLTVRTMAVPPVVEATTENTVAVKTAAELQTALNAALPGQVIQLAPGTYDADFIIKQRNGTLGLPITIRGAADFASVIDGYFMIHDSNYIHLEGLHITNTSNGVLIRDWETNGDGTVGNVVRGNRITNVVVGIEAKGNGWSGPGHNDLYIADNVLEGTNVYGDVSSDTWSDEGIVVVGENVEVAYNTLSGFGDSIGLWHTDHTRSVDIHHNYVIYGGDDGVELDFGVRNVVARENLITNTGGGVSTQYVQDGPGYAYRNLIYNILPGRGPFKIKPEAECNSGVFFLNNTSLNSGRGWRNFSGCGSDVYIINNLFTGDTTEQDVIRLDTSSWRNLSWDHNAYIYDGYFQWADMWFKSFADKQVDGRRGPNDVMIDTRPVFENAPLLPPYGAETLGTYADPSGNDYRPASNSVAVDAAKVLPTITDGFSGIRPDIGAYETTDVGMASYGVRTIQLGNPCSDGVDNDGDGLTDYPNDPECASSVDVDETDAVVGEHSLDTLEPGTWFEVPNSNLAALDPCPTTDCSYSAAQGFRAVMVAWSGGAYDTTRDRLIIWGGGHTNYGGNEIYAFDVETLEWSRLTDPSDPPAQDTEEASDTNPVSRHTYGGLTYLPNVDRFYGRAGSRYRDGKATTATWLFDFNTNTWERQADGPLEGFHSHVAVYDPNTGTVIELGKQLGRFDPTTNTWETLASYTGGAYLRYGAFDPSRNEFLIMGGANKATQVWDVMNGNVRTVTPSGAIDIFDADYPGVEYVGTTDKYYAWSGGQQLYEISPDTWETRVLPVVPGSAVPTAAQPNGTFGRFRYIPRWHALIVVNDIDGSVYLYKL